MNPTRELAPGNRPLDWAENTSEHPAGDRSQARAELVMADGAALARAELVMADGAALARAELVMADGATAVQSAVHGERGVRRTRRESEGSALSFGTARRSRRNPLARD